MRRGLIALVFALLVSACGGTDNSSTESAAAPAAVPETSAAATGGDTESSSEPSAAPTEAPEQSLGLEETPSFDGPPAPDFELELADGTVFALADEAKPVYMVFWAEW
jgi:hypothetical protein